MGARLHDYVSGLFANVEHTIDEFRPYQPIAVQFLLDNPFSALFVDVGMGKSISTLTAILQLVMDEQINHVLVIAPRRVSFETWPAEIRAWRHTAPLTFSHVREDEVVEAVNKAGQAEREVLRQEALRECALWKITDRDEIKKEVKEMLSWPSAKKRIEAARIAGSRLAVREHHRRNNTIVHIVNREQVEFLVDAWGRDWPYDCVIIDESSCMKDHTTSRFKALRRVRPLIKRLHELTATPVSETYMHLFSQVFLLDEGKRLGKDITTYRRRYFTQNRYTYKWELRPGAEEEITAKIADICLEMKAKDWFDLKEPFPIYNKVTLAPDQMTLYRQMERESIVNLPDGAEIEAETAAALSQKLAQMASGVLYETVHEEVKGQIKKRRVVHELHDHKIEKLREILDEVAGECVLIAYWHESSLARLKAAFPKSVEMDKDGKCVKTWNARKIPILLVHPQSTAHGLNMQHGGRRIIFFDIPWSLELYLQLIGRLAGARQLARKESEQMVFLHFMMAAGTVDEEIVDALTTKQSVQDRFFRLLKRMRAQLTVNSNILNREL